MPSRSQLYHRRYPFYLRSPCEASGSESPWYLPLKKDLQRRVSSINLLHNPPQAIFYIVDVAGGEQPSLLPWLQHALCLFPPAAHESTYQLLWQRHGESLQLDWLPYRTCTTISLSLSTGIVYVTEAISLNFMHRKKGAERLAPCGKVASRGIRGLRAYHQLVAQPINSLRRSDQVNTSTSLTSSNAHPTPLI